MSRYLRVKLSAIILLAACVCFTASAYGQEVILDFHSAVEIADTGLLTVAETITVRSEGQQIRRGIFRDFPTTVEDARGYTGSVEFDVVSVQRDGQTEPYRIEGGGRFTRVYIGDPDFLLPSGIYTYRINYKTDRQVRYFDDHDELLWNVTGNAWDFPILKATANLYLPAGGQVESTVIFTGPVGAAFQNATGSISADGNSASFETTAELGRREGLTVGITFPKGVVAPPTRDKELAWFWRDYRGEIIGAIGLLFVISYYIWAWRRVGRDPAPGVIVPRWESPEGISPALTRYIDKKGLSANPWNAISASLLNLAVKGYLELDDLDEELSIKLTGKAPEQPLPVGEASLYDALRRRGGTLVINKQNGTTVASAASAFRKAIYKEHRSDFYRLNLPYVIVGIVMSLIFIAAALVASTSIVEVGPALIPILIVAMIVGVSAIRLGQSKSAGMPLSSKIGSVVVLMLFGYGIVTSLSWGLFQALATSHLFATAVTIGGIVMLNVLFFHLLGAPTPLGRRMMDGIEGLRMYIKMAEADRMNLQGSPQMSPRHFETLLPYAVALGLEKPWSKAFEVWLASSAAAAVVATAAYSPVWYHGSNFSSRSLSNSIGDLSSSMASSFTASLPTPKSSSSGFSGGGGGFSGGGGGGGGGGGW